MLQIYDLKTEYRNNPMGIDVRNPRFSWKMKSDLQGIMQTSYHIVVKRHENIVWDSGEVISDACIAVHYLGDSLESRGIYSWNVSCIACDESGKEQSAQSERVSFEMGLLDESDWIAKWIEPEETVDTESRKPAQLLRLSFEAKGKVKKARLYETAHGLYESFINGNLSTEDKFKPGLTSYYYRIQYQVQDITHLINVGKNTWGVILADGWWRGVTGGSVINNFGYKLHYLGQLEIEYEDGTREMLGSSDAFKTSTGALLASDMLMGDIFDARIGSDWLSNDFDDFYWNQVHEIIIPRDDDGAKEQYRNTGFLAKKIASASVPVREKEHFPFREFKDNNGNRVLDFGQNIAGYVRMKLRNTKVGQIVKLTHGETLDWDGNFTTRNVDKCAYPVEEFQTVTYFCKGSEVEEYKPMFSIFGFRYMMLEGYEEEIQLGDFEAIAVYSDMKETASFSCSNPLVNRLFLNSLWSQKGNFMDVPVDCPTRERNAWTGDAQVYARTAATLMDTYTFYEKWLLDQKIEQYESGKVGITFPSTSSVHNPDEVNKMKELNPLYEIAGPSGNGNAGEDATGWGDAAVWIPYIIYLCYGDKTILQNQYETAKRWIDYELAQARRHNERYKDLLQYHSMNEGELDGEFIFDTCFHYGEWNEAIGIDKELEQANEERNTPTSGKSMDEKKAEAKIAAAKVGAFISYMDSIGNPIVATAYMARSVGCVARMAEVLNRKEDFIKYSKLEEKIKQIYSKYFIAENGKIEEGHQAPYVRVLAFDLCDDGKREMVLQQLVEEIKNNEYKLNTGFLSTPFLLPVLVDNGYSDIAYLILENEELPGWLYPVKRGLTTISESWAGVDTLKDSLNHYSYGAVSEFLVSYIGGIKPVLSTPGYKHFIISPTIGGSLKNVNVKFESPYGIISSKWECNNNEYLFRFMIPENTTADIILPDGTQKRVGSGVYTFSYIENK